MKWKTRLEARGPTAGEALAAFLELGYADRVTAITLHLERSRTMEQMAAGDPGNPSHWTASGEATVEGNLDQ